MPRRSCGPRPASSQSTSSSGSAAGRPVPATTMQLSHRRSPCTKASAWSRRARTPGGRRAPGRAPEATRSSAAALMIEQQLVGGLGQPRRPHSRSDRRRGVDGDALELAQAWPRARARREAGKRRAPDARSSRARPPAFAARAGRLAVLVHDRWHAGHAARHVAGERAAWPASCGKVARGPRAGLLHDIRRAGACGRDEHGVPSRDVNEQRELVVDDGARLDNAERQEIVGDARVFELDRPRSASRPGPEGSAP